MIIYNMKLLIENQLYVPVVKWLYNMGYSSRKYGNNLFLQDTMSCKKIISRMFNRYVKNTLLGNDKTGYSDKIIFRNTNVYGSISSVYTKPVYVLSRTAYIDYKNKFDLVLLLVSNNHSYSLVDVIDNNFTNASYHEIGDHMERIGQIMEDHYEKGFFNIFMQRYLYNFNLKQFTQSIIDNDQSSEETIKILNDFDRFLKELNKLKEEKLICINQ